MAAAVTSTPATWIELATANVGKMAGTLDDRSHDHDASRGIDHPPSHLAESRCRNVTNGADAAAAVAIVAARMAIVSPPRPAPAAPLPPEPERERSRHPLSGWVAGIGTTVGIAVVFFLIFTPSFVNYDAQWALLWARDAWHGFLPEYTADFAPTPHPLATAVSSLALPFGAGADIAILWLTLLSFGALVYLTYRLGAQLFNPWVGAVAALVVVSRPAIMRDTLIGYQDLPFAALVVGAVLLEAQRRHRGTPVLVLLALAGLLRPEAWVLAGLYWLYLWPSSSSRDRVRTAALAAAAPLIWAATDWIVTGDPLHSLHGTAALAEEADRRRSPEDVPVWTAMYFGHVLREPAVLGVAVGLVFAWFHARRRALLPLAVVAVMVAVFAIGPLFGLPLIRRYVETPAVLLSLFVGLAVCGWTLLPAGPGRRNWMIVGGLVALLSIAYLPRHINQLETVDRRVRLDGVLYRHLQRAAEAPRVRTAFENCAPVTTGDHRPIPFLRFWLGGDPGSVGTVASGASPMGRVLVLPRRGRTTRRIYDRETFPQVEKPAGYVRIYRNRSWRVYAARGCV